MRTAIGWNGIRYPPSDQINYEGTKMDPLRHFPYHLRGRQFPVGGWNPHKFRPAYSSSIQHTSYVDFCHQGATYITRFGSRHEFHLPDCTFNSKDNFLMTYSCSSQH